MSKIVMTETDVKDSATPTMNKACRNVNIGAVELRGFRLGMTLAEARTRIPGLSVKPINAFGEGMSFTPIRDNKYLSRRPILKDVVAVRLSFLDDEITSVTIFYDDSIKWASADEFVSQVATSLSLPAEWARFEDGDYTGQLRALRCDDFYFVAGLKRVSYRRYPLIHLVDSRTVRKIEKRVEAAAEKKRQAEAKRKKSFKP